MSPRRVERFSTRQATAEDREFLWQLQRRALGPYVARVYGWDDADQRRRFDANFDPASNRIIVDAGRDVGVLRTGEGPVEVWIANIQLLPEHQRRGIGSAAIRAVLADAHRRGLPVALQVLKVNPARRLYERLGFTTVGETETHYRMRADPPQRRSL